MRRAPRRADTICVAAQIDVPSEFEFHAAATTLKLLSDPTRLKIVWALLHGEHSVNELAEHVGAKPAAVSQQLAKLRLASLVRTRRDGNRIFYAVENEHVQMLATAALLQADHATGDPPHHRSRAIRPA